MTTPRFVIEFEPVGGAAWRDVPAAIRLRRLLKASTRSYGLRCTGARAAQQPLGAAAEPGGQPAAVLPLDVAADARSQRRPARRSDSGSPREAAAVEQEPATAAAGAGHAAETVIGAASRDAREPAGLRMGGLR